MRLTTKGRYAVTAMLDIALNHQHGPVSVTEVAERQNISAAYLEQLFGKLKRSGLLRSLRGPGGGYEFVDEIKGGRVPREYIPSVDAGIEAALDNGVLAGYPIVDVRAKLVDGSYHEVDYDAAFWSFNRVANYAYSRYSDMIVDIQRVQQELEGRYLGEVPEVDAAAIALFIAGPQEWEEVAKAMGIRYVLLLDSAGVLHMNPAMHARLAGVDPAAAERIHPNDPQRIQRALDVHAVTGRPMTELQQEHPESLLPYRVIKLVQSPWSREELRERIARRFYLMLEQGFEEEVRALLEKYDLSPDLPSMRSVGYRQMLHYIRGEWSRDEMASRGITATRQLAKRQMTWLRSEKNAIWLKQNGENAGQMLEPMLN